MKTIAITIAAFFLAVACSGEGGDFDGYEEDLNAQEGELLELGTAEQAVTMVNGYGVHPNGDTSSNCTATTQRCAVPPRKDIAIKVCQSGPDGGQLLSAAQYVRDKVNALGNGWSVAVYDSCFVSHKQIGLSYVDGAAGPIWGGPLTFDDIDLTGVETSGTGPTKYSKCYARVDEARIDDWSWFSVNRPLGKKLTAIKSLFHCLGLSEFTVDGNVVDEPAHPYYPSPVLTSSQEYQFQVYQP